MAAISSYLAYGLGWSFPWQVAVYVPVGIVSLVLVSRFTKPEPEEKLNEFYTLLDTPVGEEHRLAAAGITVKLSGESQKRSQKKVVDSVSGEILEKERVEDGLILVDLLSLPKKFSWQRYRMDILGFLVAAALAALMILLTLFLAGFGG